MSNTRRSHYGLREFLFYCCFLFCFRKRGIIREHNVKISVTLVSTTSCDSYVVYLYSIIFILDTTQMRSVRCKEKIQVPVYDCTLKKVYILDLHFLAYDRNKKIIVDKR